MILFALLLSVFSAQAQLLQSPWSVVRENVIPVSGNPAHKQIPILLIVEQGSKWDNPVVLTQTLTKTSSILAPCGVTLGEATLKTVVWEPGLMQRLGNSSPYNPPAELELVQGDLPATKPVAFLMGTGIYKTAKASNRTSVEAYKRMFPQATNIETMLGMIVMTEQYIVNTPVPWATATYNTFAHEIVHVLANTGHVQVRRNLMSDFEGRGMQTGDLTPEQCQQIQGYPY